MTDLDATVRPHPKDHHFATDHLADDLGGRSVRGGAVVFVGQASRFLLQTGSAVVLARLLTPADFGLIAMVTAVTGIIGYLKDMGLTMATVQRARVTHAQASTLFWVNLLLSIGLCGIGVAMGPLIAAFYGEPSLMPITWALSLTFFFSGVPAQHMALLRRRMRFATLASIEVAGLAAGVAVAVVAALLGAGYWALVALPITEALTQCVLAIAVSGWLPGRPRRGVGVRSMIRYGLNVSGFNVLTYIGRHADNILIGRFIGASATGLYTKAYGLLMLPLEQINGPFNSVALPVLSRLQDDPKRYAQYYYRALNVIAYVTGPLIVLLGATSMDLVPLLLGDQWLESGRIFRYLAVAAMFQPVLYTAGWIWLSLDRTKEMLRWSMVTAPTFVLSFVIGLPWGPSGVALSYAVAVNVLTPLGLSWAYRGTELTLRGAVAAVRRPYALSLAVLLVALATQPLLADAPRAVSLVGSGAVALAAGAVIAWTVPGMRRDVLAMRELGQRLRRV
jgi:O-antigen/teichoic acid export membrane protein